MRAIPLMPDAHLRAALDAPHGGERAMLIREAWSWMHTPWLHENRVKGRGVDCGNFVAGVFANAGLIEEPPLYRYPHDFYLHDDRELFRNIVAGFCGKLPILRPRPDTERLGEGPCKEDGGDGKESGISLQGPSPNLPLSPGEGILGGDIIAIAGGKLEVTHLAIVICWPVVIHALRHPAGCVTLDDGDRGQLAQRRSGIWRLKRWL